MDVTGKPATESSGSSGSVGSIFKGFGSFGPGALLVVPFALAYEALRSHAVRIERLRSLECSVLGSAGRIRESIQEAYELADKNLTAGGLYWPSHGPRPDRAAPLHDAIGQLVARCG